MKPTYLYTGAGAYQAHDIENFFTVFDIDYARVTEHDLTDLSSDGIFVVPGGKIRAYLPAWGGAGIAAIRHFVESGGVYIGICAGAYVAGRSFADLSGLGFVDAEFQHQKHMDIVTTHDASGVQFELVAENGPDLSLVTNGRILLTDETGSPQAVEVAVKKGSAILFAAHPEGSVYHRKNPREFSGAKFFRQLLNDFVTND